jgi:hypothetical protein
MNRVALTTNLSPKVAKLVERAARQSDQKTAEYVRSAVVARLKADGHDLAAALAAQD